MRPSHHGAKVPRPQEDTFRRPPLVVFGIGNSSFAGGSGGLCVRKGVVSGREKSSGARENGCLADHAKTEDCLKIQTAVTA